MKLELAAVGCWPGIKVDWQKMGVLDNLYWEYMVIYGNADNVVAMLLSLQSS